jgi:hypothetical protein
VSLIEYAKELGFVIVEEIALSEDGSYVGNLQWDYQNVKFNIRLTGDPEVDEYNLEGLHTLFLSAQGKEIIPAPPQTRPTGGGGARPAQQQQRQRQGDCTWSVSDDGPVCDESGSTFKWVPPGKSKKPPFRDYAGFYSCPASGHSTTVNQETFEAA